MCFRRKLTLRCSLSSGGGGAFGAVTSFTFRLHDQRPTVGFATAMFAQDQLPVMMIKVHKWLEVSPPVSRAISRVRESLLVCLFVQVRTPEEMGALACISMEGKLILIFLAVYNGPTDIGQQKFSDIFSSAFEIGFFA